MASVATSDAEAHQRPEYVGSPASAIDAVGGGGGGADAVASPVCDGGGGGAAVAFHKDMEVHAGRKGEGFFENNLVPAELACGDAVIYQGELVGHRIHVCGGDGAVGCRQQINLEVAVHYNRCFGHADIPRDPGDAQIDVLRIDVRAGVYGVAL